MACCCAIMDSIVKTGQVRVDSSLCWRFMILLKKYKAVLYCTGFLVEECWVVIVMEAGWPSDGRLASFRFKEWMPVSAVGGSEGCLNIWMLNV